MLYIVISQMFYRDSKSGLTGQLQKVDAVVGKETMTGMTLFS